MADIVTTEQLQNASLDVQTIEKFVNGSETQVNKPRLLPAVDVGSIAELRKKVQDKVDLQIAILPYGSKAYTTLALAQSAVPNLPANTLVTVTNDSDTTKNGMYIWNGSTLSKTVFEPIALARDYADAQDAVILKNAKDHSDSKTYISTDDYIEIKTDAGGQIYYIVDKNGNFYFPNDIFVSKNQSVSSLINNQRFTMQYENYLVKKYPSIKKLVSIATQAEDGLRKRMPAAIKTSTGLVCFYHKQIAGYDGDGTGSELWKAIIDIDANLNVTISTKELFLSPEQPQGIIKHPMLGRTSDNRIILMYEKRIETSENYVRWQCYSSDEGITWTTPTEVAPHGVNPAGKTGNSALGTTGIILTANNNRLVVPMYTVGGACFAIYSDDDGQNWTFSKWLDTSKIKGFEPSISLDLNNDILMSIRPMSSPYQRYFAKSTDNGSSWQPFTVSPIVAGATNQGVITRDNELSYMMLGNNASQSNSRTKYRLFFSYDNGKSYPCYYQPFSDEWYGGYSQIIKWVDGIYLVMIEYADEYFGTNVNENCGILMLSIAEIMQNVNYY